MPSPFQTLADLLPEPMALVSIDATLVSVNRAFAALTGVEPRLLAGRRLDEAGWSSADPWPEYLRRCARSRGFVLGGVTRRQADLPDVRYRCEGALYEPRTATHGPVILLRLLPKESSSSRFVALTQKIGELSAEISRRQLAERQAHEGRELLHVTLSSIGDAVIATDTSGHVTFMNDVAEHLTGWPRRDATGKAIGEIFRIINEESRQRVDDPIEKVLATGQVVGLANHTLLIDRSGVERPIDDSGAPIVDALGRLHGVVLVFRDVTGLRQAERKEAAARRAAEAASRAKDEFLATLSHELRTPLNAILGWTRMLLGGVIQDRRRTEALTVIERNAEMQVRLIEDLLDVSRIMVGQLRLQYAAVDLRQVIDAALDAIRPAADSKALRLSSSVRVTSDLYGDPGRLQQVIWNLLNNAVKFTPPHGEIEVEAHDSDAGVRISVSDSGEGIPEAFRPRLFDAFSQADGSFGRPHGGLGLGLTIVRSLVEAHGGQVAAESGGTLPGATFTVTLPLGRPPAAGQAEAATGTTGHVRGLRILVVEDHADSAELTRTVLEAAGADVITCPGAREALAALEGGRFDVLVADLGLPGEDGLWLIREVRRRGSAENGTLGALALTAFASPRDRQAALAAGYDEHVPKPLDVNVLMQAIGRLRVPRGERNHD